jgi:hypothetical protein
MVGSGLGGDAAGSEALEADVHATLDAAVMPPN